MKEKIKEKKVKCEALRTTTFFFLIYEKKEKNQNEK